MPAPTWTSAGFDFRNSSGYVTDPTNCTYVLPTDTSPTTRNGITFQLALQPTASSIIGNNNSTSVDARLAGDLYAVPPSSGGSGSFTVSVTLPAPGNYTLNIAVGSVANAQSNALFAIHDGPAGAFTTGSTTSGSSSITVASGSGIVPGLVIQSDGGFPANTTVVSGSGTSWTMSANATVTTTGSSMAFIAPIIWAQGNISTSSGQFCDMAGNKWSTANWPANNASKILTFSTSTLTVSLQANDIETPIGTNIAHLFIQSSNPTTTIIPPSGSIGIQGYGVGRPNIIPKGSLSMSGLTPRLTLEVCPPTAALSIAEEGVGRPNLIPSTTLSFIGQAPSLSHLFNYSPPTASLSLSGKHVSLPYIPNTGALATSGIAPSIAISGTLTLAPPTATLLLRGFGVGRPNIIPIAHLATATHAPSVAFEFVVPTTSLRFTANTPNLYNRFAYWPLLTSEYRFAVNEIAWLIANLQLFQDIWNCAESFMTEFDIYQATGAQLDILGVIIGQSRTIGFQPTGGYSPVLDDTTYRTLLLARIYQNHWDGTLIGIRNAWNLLFPGSTLLITDNQNMTVNIVVAAPLTPILQQLITNGYIIPRPQGVLYNISFSQLPLFGFDRNDPLVAGFDIGHWT